MTKKINIEAPDDLEKIEEDIIKAANKAGKKNVIVNIFTYPHKKLKRRWKVRYKFNKKHLIMDLIIAAAVLVLIGLNIFWFWGGFHYFTNKLDLTVTAPKDRMLSGQDMVFEVNYANNNKFTLEEFALSFNWPNYFELDEVAHPDFDSANNLLPIGDLKPGANGKVEFSGRIFGSFDEKQRMIVNSHFYKTNKKGERLWGQFAKTEQFKYSIVGSMVRVEADLPPVLVGGQMFDFPIKLKNTSTDITYDKLTLQPEVGIVFDDIVVEKLLPGQEVEVNPMLRVESKKGMTEVGFNLIWEKGGLNLVQNKWKMTQEVIEPDLNIGLQVNGQVEAVTPGNSVPIVINYNNNGKYTFENVRLELDLEGDYWNLNKVEKENGRLEGGKIVWDLKEIPRLALLQPKESGQIKINVGTYSSVNSDDLELHSAIRFSFRVEGQDVEGIADWQSVNLNSNLSASVYPAYFTKTGDQLGRGFLPPRVTKETKYWLFVKMVNDINQVENAEIVLSLPSNVVWTGEGSVPVGDALVYDKSSRQISWKLSAVPVKPQNIGFAAELAIIPTAGQKGIYPALVNNVLIKGFDQVTEQAIERTFGPITTKLNFDEKGKLKDGVVR